MVTYKNPVPTVDVIIKCQREGIVLIQKEIHEGYWMLPGGFMEWEETCEETAVRESFEETGLHVDLKRLVGVYSDPKREPPGTHEGRHTITIIYFAESGKSSKKLCVGDDASKIKIFPINELPQKIWGFHRLALNDFIKTMKCSECQYEYYAKTVESCLCDNLYSGIIDGTSTIYKDKYNRDHFEFVKCPLRRNK
jgi:8-oxo-dGTP diphosphatase